MADQSESTPERTPSVVINPPVFFGSAILILAFVLYAVVAPDHAEGVFNAVQGWITDSAAWFYMVAVAAYLLFVVLLAVSGYGQIKLGPDHSEPDYSYLSWFAMLFSAGMGIGLMFFGVAEPVMHFVDPPVEEAGSMAAAREAMKITFFHWGIHAWAIYALVALALAYFSFRHRLPLAIRSALYPLIGDRIYGWPGHVVDTFAVLSTMFGVATSLGIGVLQINAGLNYLFDVPEGLYSQIILIGVITLIATVSVVLGLDRGIRRLSELNLVLAAVLLVFVLIVGPTAMLLQTSVQNTGTYLSDIVYRTFNLYAYEPRDWIGGWTLFYWGWWIAWSPFVGMFIARISRGRTIREFVLGVLCVPVGFTFIWLTVFGNTAISLVQGEMLEGVSGLADQVLENEAIALFAFLENFPWAGLMSLVATMLVVTFFVTSSDSGSLVIDMLTSGGAKNTPTWQRVFWAVSEGVVAAALLVAGGLVALQTAAIVSAFPFAMILLVVAWGLYRALHIEIVKRGSLREAIVMPDSSRSPIPWQKRLANVVRFPKRAEVLSYIQQVVKPALGEMSRELKQRGIESTVADGEDGRVWIEVHHEAETDFFYSVRPRSYAVPAFVMRDTSHEEREEMHYYRAEVHLQEGSQDYDIMGWTKEQVLTDVLNQYERHMHFLHQLR